MATMVIVLLAYSLSAFAFSGLTCYLASVRQFNQERKTSRFNLIVLSNLWIIGLWPIWIIWEILRDDLITDTVQDYLEASPLHSRPDSE